MQRLVLCKEKHRLLKVPAKVPITAVFCDSDPVFACMYKCLSDWTKKIIFSLLISNIIVQIRTHLFISKDMVDNLGCFFAVS